ncbi:hypothetical protein [Microbacterium sp. 2FI]|uniref:hypothetical protein n=1 Tax=Microbacterium sp. 2FI TaxID=2502193 RepID=UPI0010F92F01|nr:hypothetical protein [Microbacterium sp. 2FI]
MSRTGDLYAIDFPHGTVDGYRQGCHGSVCGGLIACRDVYRRYQGDYSFRKKIDAGMSLAEIDAEDVALRADAVERDRTAARAERARQRVEERPTRVRAPREPRVLAIDRLGPEVARLHATRMVDRQIAHELGISQPYVASLRRNLGLLPNALPRKERTPRAPRIRVDRHDDVARLHAEGLSDKEIAAEVGLAPAYAGQLRRELGLPANRKRRPRKERPPRQPRRDHRPGVAAAHAEGLNDVAIAERLGISKNHVGTLRRELGLPAHTTARSRWDSEQLQPHGTNACYARGCRLPECAEAHRQYHRDYVKRRRAEGAREFHGTAYGYQLGCRSRTACPSKPSCADASLEAERARRRAAGIPAKVLVDASPVQAHIRDLVHAGVSIDAIAERSGLTFPIVRKMIHSRGRGRGIVNMVLAERARAILSVDLPEVEAA